MLVFQLLQAYLRFLESRLIYDALVYVNRILIIKQQHIAAVLTESLPPVHVDRKLCTAVRASHTDQFHNLLSPYG